MTSRELAEYLAPYLNKYGSEGFANQGMNATAALNALRGFGENSFDDPNVYRANEAALKASRGSAVAGGVTAGLEGLTGIVGGGILGAQTDSSVVDRYQNEIDDINAIGRNGYSSFDQLASDYARLDNANTELSYDDIRGMNTGQKIGSVATTTLAGAAAGTSIMPGWGTLAGAVAGLGAGLGGIFAGDAKARNQKQNLEFNARMALDNATTNLNAASERLNDYQFRSGVSNRAAQGGKIQRRQMSLKEFADMVMENRTRHDSTRSAGIIRQHCKGGTMVRIKVK